MTIPAPAPRPVKPVVVPFLLTVALFSLVAVLTLSPPTRHLRTLRRSIVRPVVRLFGWIPLPSALDPPSNLGVSINSYAAYANDQTRQLDRKYVAYERMSRRHRKIGRRLEWKRALDAAQDAIELNSTVTDELAAIGLDVAKREGIPYGFRSRFRKETGRVVEVRLPSKPPKLESSLTVPKSSAMQPLVRTLSDIETLCERLERSRQQ